MFKKLLRPKRPGAPMLNDFLYYSRLAEGARYLAERSADMAERNQHLAMAARYRLQSLGEPRLPRQGCVSA